MSPLKLTSAAALGSAAMVMAMELGRLAEGAPPPHVATPFQDRWESEANDLAALATSYRPTPPAPRPPPAEPDPTPPPPAARPPPMAQGTPDDLTQARADAHRGHRRPRNLCARVGMHKEYYHRGRWLYWRCKHLTDN